MALQTEASAARVAWRALEGAGEEEGWRSIAIATSTSCRIKAGRGFPHNRESLLLGFADVRIPSLEQLPRGHGFEVVAVRMTGEARFPSWLAVTRQPDGSPELFERMAEDLVACVAARDGWEGRAVLHSVLARIRAWQNFMQRDGLPILDAEAELGLLGELHVLERLLLLSPNPETVVEAWEGPANGLHDFGFVGTAWEVKSSLAVAGFPARIGSLAQLDDPQARTLYLLGVRFRTDEHGRSLPDQTQCIESILCDRPYALDAFRQRLIQAGFAPSTEEHYRRCFSVAEEIVIRVEASTPRLTRGNVPVAILDAKYELDLDRIIQERMTLEQAHAQAIGQF